MSKRVIFVDLDKTLAQFSEFKGPAYIGPPIPKMMKAVKEEFASGSRIVIFTARASNPKTIPFIRAWLKKNGLPETLKITNVKTPDMTEMWDDRAREVIPNKGEFAK